MNNLRQVRFYFSLALLAISVGVILFAGAQARAQSTSQSFPTSVTSTEISGTILPRDVGDSRLTSHYFALEGGQGDLFVNVVTRGFRGDIDVFTANGLQPLTKIVVFDDAEHETGRVIYLRKPEKMILRVQGRTPGDEPASYRIKFAGSFVAMTGADMPPAPELPKAAVDESSGIRVNSVGTIVAVIPKPSPSPVETAIKADPEVAKKQQPDEKADEDRTDPVSSAKPEKAVTSEPDKKVELVVTSDLPSDANAPEKIEEEKPAAAETARSRRSRRSRAERTRSVEPAKIEPADPMANVRLVILFKDGRKIERTMSDVFRFSVDKGVLTVISTDGSIGRFPMIDVSKVTIE